MVPDTQAAERRMWNSKPSEEMSVTKGDGAVGGFSVGSWAVIVVRREDDLVMIRRSILLRTT